MNPIDLAGTLLALLQNRIMKEGKKMKLRRINRIGWVGLLTISFFLTGFLADFRPQPVVEEEVRFTEAAHLNNRGVELYRQGNIQEALANFIVASEMDDTFWQGHYNCAVALIAVGNLNEALHHLEMSLEIDPENPTTHRLHEELLWKIQMKA